jgi:hypothetical protein
MAKPEPPVTMGVDRFRATVRGGWRVLAAVLMLGAARMLQQALDWPLLWRTDSFSCAALAATVGAIAAPGAALALSAGRWLLLSAWPGRLGVFWDAREVTLRLGPFGRRALDRAGLRFSEIPEGFGFAGDKDDRLPRIRHPRHAGDLAETILHFCAIEPIALRRILVERGLAPLEDESD